MQPAYLPGPAFFNLAYESDVFVFLDDVQFEKQSWQSRNRVLVGGSAGWLSVPVRKAPLETLLKDVLVSNDTAWQRKHARTLKQSYEGHPFYSDIREVVNVIETYCSPALTTLTTRIVKLLCDQLGINRRFEMSSHLGIRGSRSERLVSFCQHLSCTEYLSPAGAADYLAADGAFSDNRVALRYQHFRASPYVQRGCPEFVPFLSILDILANLGVRGTREYVAAAGGERGV
jgi:hypothetical protein